MPIVEKKPTVKTKIVNINAMVPVRDVTPPVYGVKKNIEMTIGDILKCLCRRAVVHQVLSDGSTVRLTTSNFRDDFEGELQEKKKTMESPKEITGSIIGVKMHEELDDVTDDDHAEPDEPNVTHHTITTENGVEVSVLGKDPDMVDPEDNAPDVEMPAEITPDLEEVANDVEEEPVPEVQKDEETLVEKEPTPEPQVSTHQNKDKPDTTNVTKKKSSKH